MVCDRSSFIIQWNINNLALNEKMKNLASDLPTGSNLNNFNDFICQFGNRLFVGTEIIM